MFKNMRYCPHCKEGIEHVNFSCNYTEWGTESGTADFSGDIINYEVRNSRDEETDDYKYKCPKCGQGLMYDEPLTEEELKELEEEEKKESEEEDTADNYNLRCLKV